MGPAGPRVIPIYTPEYDLYARSYTRGPEDIRTDSTCFTKRKTKLLLLVLLLSSSLLKMFARVLAASAPAHARSHHQRPQLPACPSIAPAQRPPPPRTQLWSSRASQHCALHAGMCRLPGLRPTRPVNALICSESKTARGFPPGRYSPRPSSSWALANLRCEPKAPQLATSVQVALLAIGPAPRA